MRSSPALPTLASAAFLLALGGIQDLARSETSDQSHATDQPDWPVIIEQLRQQLDRVPGQAAQTRQQLAIAYNNYAVSLANQGHLSEATKQLEDALGMDPANIQFRENLVRMHLQTAQAAYQAHQTQRAVEIINHALSLNPNAAEAYALLGEIEYNSQHLKEAKAAWQKALTIAPDIPEVKERLAQVTQELPVESQFERVSQFYFDIRYPEFLERSAGFDLQETLLNARRTIGADFRYWPTQKLVVLVYGGKQFRQLRQNTPEWAGGQYDGKIRIPLPSQELDQRTVTHILRHEYTHVLVYDLAHGACPIWLNEGLAEYEAWKDEQPPWPMLHGAAARGLLIPWSGFSNKFSPSSSAQEAALAYEEAHSIVRYLVERYGFWHMKRLLQAMADGTPLESALNTEFHLKPARLEDNWRQWLQEMLAASP